MVKRYLTICLIIIMAIIILIGPFILKKYWVDYKKVYKNGAIEESGKLIYTFKGESLEYLLIII